MIENVQILLKNVLILLQTISLQSLDNPAIKFLSLNTKDFSMQARDVLCHGQPFPVLLITQGSIKKKSFQISKEVHWPSQYLNLGPHVLECH